MEKNNPQIINSDSATISNLVNRSQRGRIIYQNESYTLSRKKKLTYFAIFFLIFIIGAIYSLNIFSYFDPIALCRIKIDDDLIRGNKNTIKKALVLIKKQDKPSYKIICKYVDEIGENFCQACDSRYDATCEKSFLTDQPGCYIKGTKTIYLLPEKENSLSIIENRAQAIKRLSNFSKEFWDKIK